MEARPSAAVLSKRLSLERGHGLRKLLTIVFSGLLGCAATVIADDGAVGEDNGEVLVSAGLFDVADRQDVFELGVEWRSRPYAAGLELNAGFMLNTDQGGFLFFGTRRDFLLSESWGISLGLAVGLYEEGDGLDLGGPVEFRSSIELFGFVGKRSRLGLGFYHLSHAGLYDENPGSNSVVLMYGRSLR